MKAWKKLYKTGHTFFVYFKAMGILFEQKNFQYLYPNIYDSKAFFGKKCLK